MPFRADGVAQRRGGALGRIPVLYGMHRIAVQDRVIRACPVHRPKRAMDTATPAR